MATSDTSPDKAAERDGLPKQGNANVAKSSDSKSDTLALAYKDAADILSILDNFGAEQPTANKLPKGASLTVEEQDRLAQLLGETEPKIKAALEERLPLVEEQPSTTSDAQKIIDKEMTTTVHEIPPKDIENSDEQVEHLQAESTVEQESGGIYDRVRSILDAIPVKRAKQAEAPVKAEPQVKPPVTQPVQTEQLEHAEHAPATSDKQEQDRGGDLLAKTKSHIEAVTVEQEALSRKLDVAEAGIKELENNRQDNKLNIENRAEEVEKLRSELTKISKWHESLEMQVKKLLKIAENSNTDRETLEENLAGAHEIICTLENKVQPLQEKLEVYENTIVELQNQLVDQSAMLTATHERLQREVTQRRKIEQMLRDIKSRLMPLTRKKSMTQSKRKNPKSNHKIQVHVN